MGPFRYLCKNYYKKMYNWYFIKQVNPSRQIFHKTAELKVYKPFGCTTLIYVPLELKKKLGITGERFFLVGMAKGKLCYKVY